MKKRLQNYIKQVRGISYSPEDISETPMENFIPVLKANNIQDGKLDTTSLIYIDKAKVKPEQLIRKGDLLIAASSGSKEIVGKSVFFENNFYGSFGAFCKIIRPKENIYPGYVNAFFKTTEYKRHIKKVIQGANINNLRTEDIDSLLIPEFSLSDQIRIATLLSKAEELITQRKESIKLLDEYVKSVFAEVFGDPVKNERGWKKMNLSQVCNKITDGTHFSPPIVETGKPYLTAKHVRENKIDFWANPWFISEENHAEIYKRCDPKKGDVIYIKDGATTGFAAVNKYDFEFSMLSSLALLRPEINMCLPVYLCYWLNNKSVKEQVLKMMAGGAIQRLTLKKINEIKILIPPIELQKKFTKIVEKADILNDQLKISLEYLEDLYNSISQKAFKGDLDLNRIKSKVIDEKIEKLLKGRKQAGIVDMQPKTDEEDTSYGDPFEVDEVTAKKQGAWFYNEWLRLHGKAIEQKDESIWLQSKRSGLSPIKIKFNSFEGNAIINEIVAKQNTGFGFSEFENTLKAENITYTTKEIKEFIFQKLEQKELVQYYASKEWIEAMRQPKFNPPGGFSGEGSIWFLVNKTDKAK